MTTYRRETRAEWGGVQPRARRYDVTPRGVAIHYPGPGEFVFREHDSCRLMMRRWQQMHMNRGSNDLEYGAILCHHLVLMEARTEADKPTVRVGSNGTAAANTTHTSVQLMRGTLDSSPTDAEIQALGEYVAWLREAGWGPSVTGHCDHYATACPGAPLYARLGDIRRIADNYAGDDDVTPEDIEAIADLAAKKVLRGLDWPYKAGEPRLTLAEHVTRIRRQIDRLEVVPPTEPPVDPPTEPEPEPCDGHTVAKGDTLSKIAAANGVSLADLLAANPQITDPNKIEVGDCIAVPKASTTT